MDAELTIEKDEIISLRFKRFRTTEGIPTCAVDFGKARVCRFLGARFFGTEEVCLLTGERIYRKNGFIQPATDCIMWNNVAEKEKHG